MWQCLYAFKVVQSAFPYVALYRHDTTREKRVVRVKSISRACDYHGETTEGFTNMIGRRPDKIFANLFFLEGDLEATLEVITDDAAEAVPNLRFKAPST